MPELVEGDAVVAVDVRHAKDVTLADVVVEPEDAPVDVGVAEALLNLEAVEDAVAGFVQGAEEIVGAGEFLLGGGSRRRDELPELGEGHAAVAVPVRLLPQAVEHEAPVVGLVPIQARAAQAVEELAVGQETVAARVQLEKYLTQRILGERRAAHRDAVDAGGAEGRDELRIRPKRDDECKFSSPLRFFGDDDELSCRPHKSRHRRRRACPPRRGAEAMPLPQWPLEFALEGAQVGSFTVARSPGDGDAHGPVLRLNPERKRACVELTLPPPRAASSASRDHRVTRRLARMEYRLETVRWWRVGTEGDAEGSPARLLALRLAEPPSLTSGRHLAPRAETPRARASYTWGTPGAAPDFTGGAAFACPSHSLAFAREDDHARAMDAILRGWPELRRVAAPRGETDPAAEEDSRPRTTRGAAREVARRTTLPR